jgi:hypothetical protein
VSTKVKVVNPVWNGNGRITRKVADFYASEGRAEWVGRDQIRLVLTHPKNQAAAARARAWEAAYRPSLDDDRIAQALRLFGANPPTDRYGRGGGGLAAVDHSKVRFQKPEPPIDHLIMPNEMRPSFGRSIIGRYCSIMPKFPG